MYFMYSKNKIVQTYYQKTNKQKNLFHLFGYSPSITILKVTMYLGLSFFASLQVYPLSNHMQLCWLHLGVSQFISCQPHATEHFH